jgi:AraC-like DNA-binding protein
MQNDTLSGLLRRLQLSAEIFKHARYCGTWAVDTSGTRMTPFHLIQQGTCWLHLEGRNSVELNPGDLVVLPHDKRHVVSGSRERPDPSRVNQAVDVDRTVADNVMLCGYFKFTGRVAWPILDALPDAVVVEHGNPDTDNLIRLIFTELDSDSLGSVAALEFLAHTLFVHVLRAAAAQGFQSGLLAALGDPRIGPVLGRLHSEPQRSWSLRELAGIANMSRSTFAEQFKQMTGATPIRYLQLWRIQLANDLLLSTDLSVGQIAERVGFSSDVAFRQSFREQMGVTPSAARSAARQTKKKADNA